MAAVSPRHSHNSVRHFHGHHPISSSFSVVCGRVLHASEQTVSGRNGDHLQFFLDIGGEKRYQVDINVRSKYGTNIEVYFADEELPGPFEFQYGEFPAEVSYYKLGLKDEQFSQVGERWITNKLEAELNNAKFVEIFGTTFANGRLNGVHDVHYTGIPHRDGAIAIYPKRPEDGYMRTWVFFKFAEQVITKH